MIIDKEVEIRHGNSGLTVAYEAGFLPEYEKKVLASGEIGGLIKMEFLNVEGRDVVTYNISGLEPLIKHAFSSFNDIMDFLETALTVLAHTDEYLVDIGNICLDTDHIFIETRRKRLKFVYKPTGNPVNWQQSFGMLIVNINETLQSRDIIKYFDLLTAYIDESDRTISDVSLKISELKRDAHMCGIR